MLTGKRFKLGKATVVRDAVDTRRSAVTIPAGTIIEVVSGPTEGDGMVDIFWQGRTVMMFAIDLNVREAEVTELSAKA